MSQVKTASLREANKDFRARVGDMIREDGDGESAALLGQEAPRRRHSLKSDLIGIKELIMNQWYLNILLLILPVAIASEHLEWSKNWVFLLNFVAIIPLANLLGVATEELALRTGEIVGGLLNATFGNAVELILSIAALQKGLINVVQGSLLGSILSNLLLVLGMCFFFGGLKNRPEQSFNMVGASTFSSLLLMSCIGLCVPAVFHQVLPEEEQHKLFPEAEIKLSRITAIVLGVIYLLYLVFQLFTHAEMFVSEQTEHDEEEAEEPVLSTIAAALMLIAVTLLVAVCSEYLTGAIDSMRGLMSESFIGVILLPLVGNAAEHLTAVTVAMKNKMDLAIGVAVGSSTQIALFVIPVITIAGWIIDQPMDLNFRAFDTVLLVLTILIVCGTLNDGKSNWLEGAMLIGVYIIIAIACWFNPETDKPTPSLLSTI